IGIYFIKTVDIAGAAVSGQRVGTEADHAHANLRRTFALDFDDAPRARGRAVIGGGFHAPVRREELLAVHDHAVHQAPHAVVAGFIAEILDAQRAVEIARHDPGVF